MALVIRPLIAQFVNSESSEILTEMNVYCVLTIGSQRKATSMYSCLGNQANWEDVVLFELDSAQKSMWIGLWAQKMGRDMKIGDGHIDLSKHYHRSHRESQKIELYINENKIGVLRLTIEYKSSKQEVQKLKRKISDKEPSIIQSPVVEVRLDDSPALKPPVRIPPTFSDYIIQTKPVFMEQSNCGDGNIITSFSSAISATDIQSPISIPSKQEIPQITNINPSNLSPQDFLNKKYEEEEKQKTNQNDKHPRSQQNSPVGHIGTQQQVNYQRKASQSQVPYALQQQYQAPHQPPTQAFQQFSPQQQLQPVQQTPQNMIPQIPPQQYSQNFTQPSNPRAVNQYPYYPQQFGNNMLRR